MTCDDTQISWITSSTAIIDTLLVMALQHGNATRYRKHKNESYTILTPSLDPPSAPTNPKQRSQECNAQDTPIPKRSR